LFSVLLRYCLKVNEIYLSKVTRYLYFVTSQHCENAAPENVRSRKVTSTDYWRTRPWPLQANMHLCISVCLGVCDVCVF